MMIIFFQKKERKSELNPVKQICKQMQKNYLCLLCVALVLQHMKDEQKDNIL